MKLYNINSVKIKSIYIKNFMCFDEFQIDDLDKYRLIFICGNNWCGKSTLTSESLYFGLFGESLRYGKSYKELIKWDVNKNEKTIVDIGLVCNFSEYSSILNIKRVIKNNNYTFDVTSSTNDFGDLQNVIKKKEFNNLIADIIGINKDKFNILYLKSPYSGNLFESSSDLLISITQSNYIKELQSEFNEIYKALKSKIKWLKEGIDLQISTRESYNKNINKINVEEYNNKIDNINKRLDSINKLLDKYNNYIKKIDDYINNIDKKIINIAEVKTTIKSNINNNRKLKAKYKKLIDAGKCPTCEQQINSNLYDSVIESLDKEINEDISKYNKYNAKYNEIVSIKNKYIDKRKKIYKYTDKLNSDKLKLEKAISKLRTEISKENQNEKNIEKILSDINKKINKLEEDLNETKHEYVIIEKIVKKLLSKNSKYINDFYNYRINSFLNVFNVILNKMSNGTFYSINITLGNKPIINNKIRYAALSTSQRKIVDMAFVISYIVYKSKDMVFKTFILDEFMEANFDKDTSTHIFNIIRNIAKEYNLQFIITSNIFDYIYIDVTEEDDVLIINIHRT